MVWDSVSEISYPYHVCYWHHFLHLLVVVQVKDSALPNQETVVADEESNNDNNLPWVATMPALTTRS